MVLGIDHSNQRLSPPAVLEQGRRLGPDDERLVVGDRERAGCLQLEVAQEVRPDGLDLHVGELLAEATVTPSAEAHPTVGVLLVLITRCQKAVGVIGLRRLGENLLTKARVNRRKEDGVGARNDDILDLKVSHCGTHKENERRSKAKRLGDACVKERHVVPDRVVVQVGPRSFLLGQQLVQKLLVAAADLVEHEQARPRGGDRRGVLAGEEKADHQARDNRSTRRRPVVELRVHEGLKGVVFDTIALAAAIHDLLEHLDHRFASTISIPVSGNGEVRSKERDGLAALIEQRVELKI
mmetsp:Transcript_5641/g.18123  ORF Transcript_5641/g.18123 Transcript_5641/m.18123 type:complete len:296 (+) Transcript_5641:304-1191(+)